MFYNGEHLYTKLAQNQTYFEIHFMKLILILQHIRCLKYKLYLVALRVKCLLHLI